MAEPYIHIALDKPRKLRYRHNDLSDLYKVTGKNWLALLREDPFYGTSMMLTFGLRWMDQKMTPERAGDLIQDHWLAKGRGLDELTDVITDALRAAGIIRAPKAGEPPPAEDESEGNASGAT